MIQPETSRSEGAADGVERAVPQERGPILFLSLAWLVTLAVLLGTVWFAYDSYERFGEAADRDFRIQEVRGRIIHLDEVLTMSARMAVTTGDDRWEERYLESEPELAATLAEAEALVGDLAGASQTEAANATLIALEGRAFELVRQGRQTEARELLFGARYEDAKVLYAQGMEQLGDQLASAAGEATRRQQRRALLQIVGGVVAIPLLLAGWLFALRVLRRWRSDLRRRDGLNRHQREQRYDEDVSGIVHAEVDPYNNRVLE